MELTGHQSPPPPPSLAEGAAVIESELSMVLCIVLAPSTITDGLIEDSFDVNQDTAPGGAGILLASWQCTITSGRISASVVVLPDRNVVVPVRKPLLTRHGPRLRKDW